MRPSVRSAFVAHATRFEGRVPWLYCDILGLVTTGIGNLAEPVSLALAMPWRMPDGSRASREEVMRQWSAVKAQSEHLKSRHYNQAAPVTTMRLAPEDIDALVLDKLDGFEAHLVKSYFPDFEAWPADAQLGALSMAWALGPGFPATFKNFRAAAQAQDWEAAGLTCKIRSDNNPGVRPRNAANEICFGNARVVADFAMDRAVLHWPAVTRIPAPPPVPTPLEPAPRPTAPGASLEELTARADAAAVDQSRVDVAEQTTEALRERADADTEPPPTESVR